MKRKNTKNNTYVININNNNLKKTDSKKSIDLVKRKRFKTQKIIDTNKKRNISMNKVIEKYNSKVSLKNIKKACKIETIIKDNYFIEVNGEYKTNKSKNKDIKLRFSSIKTPMDFVKANYAVFSTYNNKFIKIDDFKKILSQNNKGKIDLDFIFKQKNFKEKKIKFIFIVYFFYDEKLEKTFSWGFSFFNIKKFNKFSYFEVPIYFPHYLLNDYATCFKNYKQHIRVPFTYLIVVNEVDLVLKEEFHLKYYIKSSEFEIKYQKKLMNDNPKIDLNYYKNKFKPNYSLIYNYSFLKYDYKENLKFVLYLDFINIKKNLKLNINIFIVNKSKKISYINKNIIGNFNEFLFLKFISDKIQTNSNNQCIFLEFYYKKKYYGFTIIPCISSNKILFGKFSFPIIKNKFNIDSLIKFQANIYNFYYNLIINKAVLDIYPHFIIINIKNNGLKHFGVEDWNKNFINNFFLPKSLNK